MRNAIEILVAHFKTIKVINSKEEKKQVINVDYEVFSSDIGKLYTNVGFDKV